MWLENPSIEIRPFHFDDLSAVHDYMSEASAVYFVENEPLDITQTRGFLASHIGEQVKAYAVICKSTKTLVGHIEFFPWFGEHTYEIGWVINPLFQRKGFAYQAANLVLEFAFNELNLHRVVATCQPENPASFRLMEKLGMIREGHSRQCIPKANGVWWDEYFYAILKRDFDQHQKNSPAGIRQQYHFRQSDAGLLAWDVLKLIHLSKELDIVSVPLSQILEVDEHFWYELGGATPTCRNIAEHSTLIENADLHYPIILCHEGRIMDGMHRVCKALNKGDTHIRYVQFPTSIPPDYIGVEPDDLPY